MMTLTLAGIPIAVGANEAVHRQRLLDAEAEAPERHEEFYLDVFCDAASKKKDEVNGAMVVLRDGKVYLWPKDPSTNLPADDPSGGAPPHPFTGFYLPFPSTDLPHRPMPCAPILGLVSTIPTSRSSSPSPSPPSSPSPPPKEKAKSKGKSKEIAAPPRSSSPKLRAKPKLNWLYADAQTRELRYGPRAEAKKNVVGPWDWTDDEQGLTLEDEECLVAVEERRGGYGWAVYWDREDDALKGVGVGKEKRVLRCSLERRVVVEKEVTGLGEED